ncbi:MAG: hypothetical protein GDA56_04570 [Hormoscilla sp. GM7CHS1pb]|nr:hypothetical protein [Hormoscilla sp. GM7CHS1pb]
MALFEQVQVGIGRAHRLSESQDGPYGCATLRDRREERWWLKSPQDKDFSLRRQTGA